MFSSPAGALVSEIFLGAVERALPRHRWLSHVKLLRIGYSAAHAAVQGRVFRGWSFTREPGRSPHSEIDSRPRSFDRSDRQPQLRGVLDDPLVFYDTSSPSPSSSLGTSLPPPSPAHPKNTHTHTHTPSSQHRPGQSRTKSNGCEQGSRQLTPVVGPTPHKTDPIDPIGPIGQIDPIMTPDCGAVVLIAVLIALLATQHTAHSLVRVPLNLTIFFVDGSLATRQIPESSYCTSHHQQITGEGTQSRVTFRSWNCWVVCIVENTLGKCEKQCFRCHLPPRNVKCMSASSKSSYPIFSPSLGKNRVECLKWREFSGYGVVLLNSNFDRISTAYNDHEKKPRARYHLRTGTDRSFRNATCGVGELRARNKHVTKRRPDYRFDPFYNDPNMDTDHGSRARDTHSVVIKNPSQVVRSFRLRIPSPFSYACVQCRAGFSLLLKASIYWGVHVRMIAHKPVSKVQAYTRQKAKSKYRTRMRLERASQKQSSDTHKTPYD
ncbi:hypothetical protein PR048_023976 [Dryococelus australis]|uniref:Uncharacterized protein n=1 Tax=Dryococelus australis TaxID=614101 RepID=A0ABQ9GVN6_9NEOP|nr:hypothetical protein PR048_023976 [Dryococelus australis]